MLDRRLFLASLGSLPLLPHAKPSGAKAPPRLVVVLLRGAVDGLSVCVPHADPDYRRDRPSIALPPPGQPGGVLPLDDRFGLHPALAPLMPLWQAGQLGFVQACGQPGASRSHFEAQDLLESGQARAGSSDGDGWLARLVSDLSVDDSGPVRALYSAASRPRLLRGPGAAEVAALPAARANGSNAAPPRGNPALAELYAADPRYAEAYAAAQAGRAQVGEALMAAESMAGGMQGMNGMDASASGGAPAPGSFPSTAQQLARAMRADPRLQVAALELGGWDTHARQGAAEGQLANRLAPLGQGLRQLADGLGPLWGNTAVMVVSEFGRTVAENGNGGTDHGRGNAVWLLGGALGPRSGGRVQGEWPGLARAARADGRDLAITSDVRAVAAGLAAQHLRLRDAQLSTVFPGFDGRPMAV